MDYLTKYSSWATNTVVIPPATALSNIGVTFVVNNQASARDRFVIKFDSSRGVMEMPPSSRSTTSRRRSSAN